MCVETFYLVEVALGLIWQVQHVGEDPAVLCYIPITGKSAEAQGHAFHLLVAAIHLRL